MGINDVNKLNKNYNQKQYDEAFKEGYDLAEKQYSENIKKLKKQIKELEFKNKLDSLESATQINKEVIEGSVG